MRRPRGRSLILASLLAIATGAAAERIDNFLLLDQHGAAHELYYLSDAAAVVIMVQGNGCPIVRNAWPTLKALKDEYSGKGVEFLMLNSNLQDDRDTIRAEAEAFGIDVPILVDETQLIGESLDLIRTAEVLIIDPDGWQIAYRGPLDDRLTYERQKAEAKEHYVRDALDATLAGRPVEVPRRDSLGCLINFPEKGSDRHRSISYSETVAPILAEHCLGCHRPGGIAPWAMTEHRLMLGFAPMIREVLRTDRMPPWHSDPHVGQWLSDRSLSVDEIKTLVHWIEAGAPRGTGPDPLEELASPAPDWPLGEPDLIVTVPAFDVPATGVVDYQYPAVPNPLEHSVWVKAVAIAPRDRAVVHHVLVGHSRRTDDGQGGEPSVFENYLHGYAPGAEASVFPDDTGALIEPGGAFVFQMHYTPTGKAATDVTRLGLYFHDRPPVGILRHHAVVNPAIQIPPHAARHEESAYFEFDDDAILFSLFPHAHFRGRSSRFVLRYPDGTEKVLLSVPKYDFNWQREYNFAEPVSVPAGSRIIHRTVYDNSAQNPGNPDPSRTVPWGQQSWDEMLYGAMRFRWRHETAAAPTHDPALAGLRLLYGYADRNMDGRLALGEMPEQTRTRFEADFDRADSDGDGGISVPEFREFTRPGPRSGDDDVGASPEP